MQTLGKRKIVAKSRKRVFSGSKRKIPPAVRQRDLFFIEIGLIISLEGI